jgi:hypothetical protein
MREQPFGRVVDFFLKNEIFKKLIMDTDNLSMFADIALASNHSLSNSGQQTNISIYAMEQSVAPFVRHGFTSVDMMNAGYPQSMINTMTLLEKKSKTNRTTNPYNLVNYNELEWYTSTSPHVICPNCKGSFTLKSNHKIRTHSCQYYKLHGPPSITKKKVVIATPIIVAQRATM